MDFNLLSDLNRTASDGVRAWVTGQTTLNDGFNAQYRFDINSTATPDGLNVIQIGSAPGRWILKFAYGVDKSATQSSINTLNTLVGTNTANIATQSGLISGLQAEIDTINGTLATQGTTIATINQNVIDLASNTTSQINQVNQSLNNYATLTQLQAAIASATQAVYGAVFGAHIAVPDANYTITDFNNGAYFLDALLSTSGTKTVTLPSPSLYDGRLFYYHNTTSNARNIVGTNVKTTNNLTTITTFGGPSVNALLSNGTYWTAVAIRTS